MSLESIVWLYVQLSITVIVFLLVIIFSAMAYSSTWVTERHYVIRNVLQVLIIFNACILNLVVVFKFIEFLNILS